MKTCKLEECTHCKMNHYTGMYICTLINEEVFEDTDCSCDEE